MPNELTFDKPNALFFHTGQMQENTDLKIDQTPDLKYSDYIVFDES